jgi:TetR/AcrR family transcriptional regulator, regulator of cefoperazone and chloramphenicol sensitivity
MRMNDQGEAAFADLTARARIRDAALRSFTEHGFDRATIREIAQAAGVSPGLVRHHFGSKEGLRQACDAYALQALHSYVDKAVTEAGLSDPATVSAEVRDPLNPLSRYLARALIDDSGAAARIYDALVAMTEQSLRETDKQRAERPAADMRTRAALLVAMSLGIPAFQAHISRSIGADVFGPEGDQRVALALLDIYSHPVITADNAKSMGEGLAKPGD